MADFSSIDVLLNTVTGMEVLRNNVKQDDGTDTIVGVNWFKFNNASATNLYASGNSYIGIGANASHVKICSRDGALYSLYRQEGTLFNYYKFLKIRWEGYSYYGSMDISYAIKYELFLFDTGDLFLNVLQTPTSTSYLGTSEFLCNTTTALTIPAGSTPQITFTHLDATGLTWNIAYEKIIILPPYDRKYLLADKLDYYTITNGVKTKISIKSLNSQAFEIYGFDEKPSSEILKTIANPKILYWQNSQDTLPEKTATITAKPFNQTVITNNIDMSDATIKGIEKIVLNTTGNVFVAISIDNGVIWKGFNGTIWGTLDGNSGMSKEIVETITIDQWAAIIGANKAYRLKIILTDNAVLNSIIVDYIN